MLNAGRAKEWFSGWVSKPLANDADAQDGIALLRESYDEEGRPTRVGKMGFYLRPAFVAAILAAPGDAVADAAVR